jgi:stage III sporulation protein AD
LRKYQPELSLSVGIVAGVIVLVAVIKKAIPSFSALHTLLSGAGLPTTYTQVLFKALGVCLITQLASDTCRDAGETALAAKAEFVGKVTLLILSLPLFEEITGLALSLMQG